MNRSGSFIIGLLGLALFGLNRAVANYSSRWYRSLLKPRWVTFERLIPFIWAFIYVATTASAALTWLSPGPRRTKASVLSLLGVNALLNTAYSIIFTRRQDLPGAVVDAAAIAGTIGAATAAQWASWRPAALLNLPYLLWSSLAAYITWRIYQLNRGRLE